MTREIYYRNGNTYWKEVSDSFSFCKESNYFSQQYKDAKTRIGTLGCPYCQENGNEFTDDTKIVFRIHTEIESFLPNRTTNEGDYLYLRPAELYTVFLCTAEVFCSCGKVVKVLSRARYIDQMQEIIDNLKGFEIQISMPQPRDWIVSREEHGETVLHRELITYFLVQENSDEFDNKYYEDPDDQDDEDDQHLEYTFEGIYIPPTMPEYVLEYVFIQKQLLNSVQSSYVAKI
jgi:hypothetical protein